MLFVSLQIQSKNTMYFLWFQVWGKPLNVQQGRNANKEVEDRKNVINLCVLCFSFLIKNLWKKTKIGVFLWFVKRKLYAQRKRQRMISFIMSLYKNMFLTSWHKKTIQRKMMIKGTKLKEDSVSKVIISHCCHNNYNTDETVKKSVIVTLLQETF